MFNIPGDIKNELINLESEVKILRVNLSSYLDDPNVLFEIYCLL